jgi:hypothetical protein
VQLDGADDEAEVAESLRSVAQLTLGDWIPLLAQQADVVAQAEEALKQLDRVLPLTSGMQGVHEPE